MLRGGVNVRDKDGVERRKVRSKRDDILRRRQKITGEKDAKRIT